MKKNCVKLWLTYDFRGREERSNSLPLFRLEAAESIFVVSQPLMTLGKKIKENFGWLIIKIKNYWDAEELSLLSFKSLKFLPPAKSVEPKLVIPIESGCLVIFELPITGQSDEKNINFSITVDSAMEISFPEGLTIALVEE